MAGSKYWSAYRANDAHYDAPIKVSAALDEVERAILEAFPTATEVTARTKLWDVLVTFLPGQRPVSVRLSSDVLDTYRRSGEAPREKALRTLRLVCAFAFAREYTPDHGPDPFVIDAEMALDTSG
jgi:uncharacterized protein (DUF4415 family)